MSILKALSLMVCLIVGWHFSRFDIVSKSGVPSDKSLETKGQ
jgi:hypothetical protein